MDSDSYKRELRNLLRSAIEHKDRARLTNYIGSQTEIPSSDVFLVTFPDLREKYWQAFFALHKELVPNYISAEDIWARLWELFREITLDWREYQAKQDLDQKISVFCGAVKKPLQPFDILYEIRNLDIGETKFNLSNVELFKITTGYLENLGLRAGISALRDNILERWGGRTVAKVEINVSDIDRAYESGFTTVNSVLDIIRLAAAREKLSSLHDEMLLWELGESIVIPRVKPEKGTLLSTSSPRIFRPLIIPMDNTILRGIQNESTWNYILDGKLPQDIDVRVRRAMQWISHAVTSSNLDYKLVDLCTALEILLLPNHKEGKKGELISLRQVLIGRGSSYNPVAILYRYEKRSQIVHGGILEITGYSDYWHLLICCLQVIQNIVDLSRNHPNIATLKDLIGLVETPESLRHFIKNCEWIYDGKTIKDIKDAAQKRLDEIEKVGTFN
jgi:hypothetical protein